MSEDTTQVAAPAFGSQEYRDYFRTVYVDKDAKARFLGIKNGNLYLAIIFMI